ncbi:MAG: helix-turn-helix transcriptional regulator [Bacteroidota bacterium]
MKTADSVYRAQAHMYALDKMVRNGRLEMREIGDVIDFYHLSDAKNYSIQEISQDALDEQNMTMEQIREYGELRWLHDAVHKDDLPRIIHRADEHFEAYGENQAFSFFQRVKSPINPKQQEKWYFTTMKRIDNVSILNVSHRIENLDVGLDKIVRVVDDFDYMKRHLGKFAGLTKREKEIINLLVHGANNPQISERLFISRSTVEQHRKNINRKLELKSFAELFRFAQAFDIW